MTHEVTREDLLARVQHLTPVIQEYTDRAEQERHLADPVVAAIQEAGLYRMLIPRALGGLQVDPLTFYQVVEALAHIDGSTGWCMFINGSAPLSIGFLQDEAAETMCGNGRADDSVRHDLPLRACGSPQGRLSRLWPLGLCQWVLA